MSICTLSGLIHYIHVRIVARLTWLLMPFNVASHVGTGHFQVRFAVSHLKTDGLSSHLHIFTVKAEMFHVHRAC